MAVPTVSDAQLAEFTARGYVTIESPEKKRNPVAAAPGTRTMALGPALVQAAEAGNIDEVRRLVVLGEDPERRCPGENTALVAAAVRGHAAIIEVLIDRGACLDTAPRANGCTAFHTACLHGHAACAAALLDAGCDTSLRDNSLDRRTGADWAVQNGHTAVLREIALASGDGVPIELEPDPRVLSTLDVSVIPLQIPPDRFTLMVFNLPRGSERVDDETLCRIFAPFGPTYEAQMSEGVDASHGFVRFYCMHDARAAQEALDGKFIRGRKIRIKLGNSRRCSVPAQYRPRAPLPFYKATSLLNHYLPLGFSTEIVSLDLEAEAGPGIDLYVRAHHLEHVEEQDVSEQADKTPMADSACSVAVVELSVITLPIQKDTEREKEGEGGREGGGEGDEERESEKEREGRREREAYSEFSALSLELANGVSSFLCRYSCTVRVLLRGRSAGERCHTDGTGIGEHADTAGSRLQARSVAMKRAKATALQAALAELVLVVDHVDQVATCFFEDEM